MGTEKSVSKDASTEEEPTLRISIYGGKKEDVERSLKQHESASGRVYQTWVNIRALKRLGFLFEGGVESAGGLLELLLMFTIVAIVFVIFAFWQLVIFFLVIGILALLSGGVALKYLRGTFIEGDEAAVDMDQLASFAEEQVISGHFVEVNTTDRSIENETIPRVNRDTKLFKNGIHLSLISVTLFLAIEIFYQVAFNRWLTNYTFLVIFVIIFLIGVLIMNIGIALRRRHQKQLEKE